MAEHGDTLAFNLGGFNFLLGVHFFGAFTI